jgi:hypothetical protein
MPAIKLTAFGGMVPAQDDRLLPEQSAALAENTWLYSGALEGIRVPKLVHTCSNTNANRVFRVPKDQVSKDYMVDSYWLEFNRQDVDVVKAPMDNDAYGRFYWAGEADGNGFFPRYNTRSRIAAGSSYYKLGVPAPTVAPVVSTAPSSPLAAANGFYRFNGNSVDMRYSKRNLPTNTLDRTFFSYNGRSAVLAYRNSSNVITYDALTQAQELDPNFPQTPGLSANQILTSRAYLYTWVTGYGEEGPPSPATVLNGLQGDKWDIRLTAPTYEDTNLRNLTKVRIYRSITSSLGQATYFRVAELDIGVTTYQDTNTDETVSSNNQLQSTFWDAPPETLRGIISMPNGMIAGFDDNEIWFSEPYRPHAWPALYTLSVDFKIVGLGVMGQTLIVCTESLTYACTGINPGSMTLAVIGSNQPCLSRGGIVSTRNGVLYPSPNGVVLATPAGLAVITESLLTRDKWDDLLNLPKLHAALLGGAYYAFGTVSTGVFQENAFQMTAFERSNTTGSKTGALIDPSDSRTAYVTLTAEEPTRSVFNDPWTGEVLTVRSNKVYHHDVSTGTRSPYLWRSKIFQVPFRNNLEAMKVFFDVPDGVTGNYGQMRLYANDTLVWERELLTSGVMMRLPSGFKSDFWQVEIEGQVILWSVQMATSARELAGV